MNHADTTNPDGPRRGNFVLLRADELWLLLPQHEVGAVEYLAAPPVASFGQPGLHLQQHADGPRQLAALSSTMQALDVFPTDRRLVTALAGTPIAWCWNEVKVLIDAHLQPLPLPRVLRAPGMPVQEFIEHTAGLAFVCSAQAICTLAGGRGSLAA